MVVKMHLIILLFFNILNPSCNYFDSIYFIHVIFYEHTDDLTSNPIHTCIIFIKWMQHTIKFHRCKIISKLGDKNLKIPLQIDHMYNWINKEILSVQQQHSGSSILLLLLVLVHLDHSLMGLVIWTSKRFLSREFWWNLQKSPTANLPSFTKWDHPSHRLDVRAVGLQTTGQSIGSWCCATATAPTSDCEEKEEEEEEEEAELLCPWSTTTFALKIKVTASLGRCLLMISGSTWKKHTQKEINKVVE